ncbi:hypothetical protein O6H91_Y211300 [Diphasiastrum complanatum]|nr:hypothetical protein O6H91_Y211300 [Diphasiastrum complanatum]
MEMSLGRILTNQSIMRKVPTFIRVEATTTLHAWAVLIAGIFVLLALSLSSFLLFEHLTSYRKPEEQKWLIGVIFMVPIYSTESFLSLWNPKLALECDILRNCYEAFALYSFGCYMIACLGGDDRVVEFFERQAKIGPRTPLLIHSGGRAVVKHPLPLNFCMPPWSLGQDFYDIVKFGIVQYVSVTLFFFMGLPNECEASFYLFQHLTCPLLSCWYVMVSHFGICT